jgi:GNAT superfamily N-acetyltransferase
LESEFIKVLPRGRSDYREVIAPVSEAVWAEFIHHDAVAAEHWDGLYGLFADYQFALLSRRSGAVAGVANSVPLVWESDVGQLPEEGWDWALIKSAMDRRQGLTPNMLCAIQIAISPGFQGRGLSRIMLDEMIALGRAKNLSVVIAPVRPSLKDRYPLTPIDTYIKWADERGLPYDPWLRVHVRRGGRILKPCHAAMKIVGTVSEWEEWTGLRFFESGNYVVPGALLPVTIHLEEDVGEYIEPNVWVVHEVDANS